MSHVAERAAADPRSRIRGWAGGAAALLPAAVLTGLAALLVLRWWEQDAAIPLSWQRPPAETLFLLPAAPVVGLLALRLVVGGRYRTVAGQHLMSWTARWAAAWAVVTAGGLAFTVSRIFGVPLAELRGVDNLVTVVAASDSVRAQLSLLWVSLLLAMFADRLGGWREALAALALTVAALLAAAPAAPAGAHAHTSVGHPAVMLLAAAQLVALAVWLGALAAVTHLRKPSGQLQRHLTRFGGLVSAAAFTLGATVVAARLLEPGPGTPVAIAVAQLLGVGAVAAVGHRHRNRTMEQVATGRPALLAGLVGGEVVVLTALLMLSGVLPVLN